MVKKQPPEQDRQPPERKTPPMGGNFVWYLLALGVGTLFLVTLLGSDNAVEIPYSELIRLIEKGAPAENKDAYIDVDEGPEDKQIVVRYSDLAELKVGQHEITGRVTKTENPARRPRSPNRTSPSIPPAWDWKTTKSSSTILTTPLPSWPGPRDSRSPAARPPASGATTHRCSSSCWCCWWCSSS